MRPLILAGLTVLSVPTQAQSRPRFGAGDLRASGWPLTLVVLPVRNKTQLDTDFMVPNLTNRLLEGLRNTPLFGGRIEKVIPPDVAARTAQSLNLGSEQQEDRYKTGFAIAEALKADAIVFC